MADFEALTINFDGLRVLSDLTVSTRSSPLEFLRPKYPEHIEKCSRSSK